MDTSAGMVIDKSTRNLSTIFSASGVALWINIVAILFIFLWVIAIIWTTKDIIHRTNSFSLQVISIVLVTLLTPIV